MPEEIVGFNSLPLNFTQGFLPDRALLSRLLAFAKAEGAGDKEAISQATGIPTGKSSGKVEPMIHYASGMGLVNAARSSGVWRLTLTKAGHLISDEDPFLDELPTQWFCHLMLCRRYGFSQPAVGVADAWFALFAEGTSRLGNPFERESFCQTLVERHGQKSYLRSLSGLVPRTYVEQSCLGDLGIMRRMENGKDERYKRLAAPNDQALYPAYAIALFLAWDTLFPDRQQIPFYELTAESRVFDTLLWQRSDAERLIRWMSERGMLQLDNLTGTTMALRLTDSAKVLRGLYNEVV